MTQNPEDYELFHYGVKGMKWGVRRERPSGASRRTDREARKDAREYTAAKMFYGEGAGTRRKLINNTVSAKAKKDPTYKKAFDYHVENTDMAKRAAQARSKRKRTDTTNTVKKTGRGIGHALRGNSQYASLTAVALVAGGTAAWRNGGKEFVQKNGAALYKNIKNAAEYQKTKNMMRGMGL